MSDAAPILELIPGDQMNLDLVNSSVTANGDEWDINLHLRDDNGDTSLPSNYRYHYHVKIGGLNTETGETINFTVSNWSSASSYTPFFSIDDGTTYNRVNTVPGYVNGSQFTLTIPAGVESVRIAKYAPWTFTMFEALETRLNNSPHVTQHEIGRSAEDRPIHLFELTDHSVPNTNKKRVWIHAAVHPGENTAYFTAEGLLDWLTSGTYAPEALLDQLIFDVIPMANPDGVWHGNSRTTAQSLNMEIQYTPPWNTTVPECQALQSQIEIFMGTEDSPGDNPIVLLLNVHSSHGLSYPFHFVHVPNYNVNGQGVIPQVNALETRWVSLFRHRSAYVDMGGDASSTLSGRKYIEAMMNDRYSVHTDIWEPVMAITFEGTYQYGPTPGVFNTPDDYRQVGMEMGLAIGDYFEIDMEFSGDSWMAY